MGQDAADSNDLCVSCGICCEGALFDHGQIWPEEEERARELGFTIVDTGDGDRRNFLLPCGNLCGSVCQVYEQRLRTCRTYKCMTLEALEAGEIERAEADRRIEAAKAAIARIRERLLPGERFLALRRRFGDDPAPPADFQIDMVRWQTMMDRYFRKPHQRVTTPEPEAQEPIASPAVSPEPCTVSTTMRAGGGSRPESRRSQSTQASRRS